MNSNARRIVAAVASMLWENVRGDLQRKRRRSDGSCRSAGSQTWATERWRVIENRSTVDRSL